MLFALFFSVSFWFISIFSISMGWNISCCTISIRWLSFCPISICSLSFCPISICYVSICFISFCKIYISSLPFLFQFYFYFYLCYFSSKRISSWFLDGLFLISNDEILITFSGKVLSYTAHSWWKNPTFFECFVQIVNCVIGAACSDW